MTDPNPTNRLVRFAGSTLLGVFLLAAIIVLLSVFSIVRQIAPEFLQDVTGRPADRIYSHWSLLALTGLATFEQDDDGQAAVTAFIDEKELGQILDLIAEKEANITKFLAYLKIESLEKMPKAMYQKAVASLQAKKAPVAK